MVAVSTISDPFPPPVEWIVARRGAEVLLTVNDVQAMVRAGIVPEDGTTELLGGVLVYTDKGATSDAQLARKSSAVGAARDDLRLARPKDWVAAREWFRVPITVKDLETMIKAGVVAEDATTELLHGVLVYKDRSALGEDPLSIGDEHTICVEALSDLRSQINNPNRHVRSQQPLVCGETHEPEPDCMIIRGALRGLKGKATASDALCVIEVADSSYERDSGEKLFGYARAAIPQYIIINLRNRTAEVYTNPDSVAGTYGTPVIIASPETLSLRVGDNEFFEIAVRDLLP